MSYSLTEFVPPVMYNSYTEKRVILIAGRYYTRPVLAWDGIEMITDLTDYTDDAEIMPTPTLTYTDDQVTYPRCMRLANGIVAIENGVGLAVIGTELDPGIVNAVESLFYAINTGSPDYIFQAIHLLSAVTKNKAAENNLLRRTKSACSLRMMPWEL